jgi:hypothetical protein
MSDVTDHIMEMNDVSATQQDRSREIAAGYGYSDSFVNSAQWGIRMSGLDIHVKPQMNIVAATLSEENSASVIGAVESLGSTAREKEALGLQATQVLDILDGHAKGIIGHTLAGSSADTPFISLVNRFGQGMSRYTLSGISQVVKQPIQQIVSSAIKNSTTLGLAKFARLQTPFLAAALESDVSKMDDFYKKFSTDAGFAVFSRADTYHNVNGKISAEFGVDEKDYIDKAKRKMADTVVETLGENGKKLLEGVSWFSDKFDAVLRMPLRLGDGYYARVALFTEYAAAHDAREKGRKKQDANYIVRNFDPYALPAYDPEIGRIAALEVNSVTGATSAAGRGNFFHRTEGGFKIMRSLTGVFKAMQSTAASHAIYAMKDASRRFKDGDIDGAKQEVARAAGVVAGNFAFYGAGFLFTGMLLASLSGGEEETDELKDLYAKEDSGEKLSKEEEQQKDLLEATIVGSKNRERFGRGYLEGRTILQNVASSVLMIPAAFDAGNAAIGVVADPFLEKAYKADLQDTRESLKAERKSALAQGRTDDAAQARLELLLLRRAYFIKTDKLSAFGGMGDMVFKNGGTAFSSAMDAIQEDGRPLTASDVILTLGALGIGQSDITKIAREWKASEIASEKVALGEDEQEK